MNTGDYAVIIAILIYFMVVLIIGFSYARRANKSSSEYFLGGRKVGPWFTALSAEASDMSGYLLMGLRVSPTSPAPPTQAGHASAWHSAPTSTGCSSPSACVAIPKRPMTRSPYPVSIPIASMTPKMS